MSRPKLIALDNGPVVEIDPDDMPTGIFDETAITRAPEPVTLPTLGQVDAALEALEHRRDGERRLYVADKRRLNETRKLLVRLKEMGLAE